MALLFLPQTLESIDVHCFGHLLYEMTYGRPPDSVPVDSFPPAPSMAVGQYRAWEWGLLGPGSLQSYLASFQSPRKIQRKLSSSTDRAHISKYSDSLSVCPCVSSLWQTSSKLHCNSGSNRVERELWPAGDLIRSKSEGQAIWSQIWGTKHLSESHPNWNGTWKELESRGWRPGK